MRPPNKIDARPTMLAVMVLAALWMLWPLTTVAQTVAPGVTHSIYEIAGPRRVFVLSIERGRPEYKFKLGWPQQRRNFTSRAAVSTIANLYDSPPAHDVLAAVNGSFFESGTSILGAAASAGEMLEQPNTAHFDTFFFGPSRRPCIRESVADALGSITFAGGSTATLHDYNRGRVTGRIVAYTPQWAPTTGTTSQGVEVILVGVSYPMRSHKEVSGLVTAIRTGSNSLNNTIPPGGMVLSAQGAVIEADLAANIQVGDRLRMRFATNTADYNNADMAISGAGWLVKDGVANTANWSRQSSDFVNNRHPRTVLGWKSTHYYMVVVDGRTSASIGMTFQQLADFLIGTLGCEEAINLDGGGSSTMWVDGSVRNNPSDGSERSVANAVLLVRQNTATALPFTDNFGPGGRQAGWDDKFTYNPVMHFAPTSPGGDGYVVVVSNPNGGAETMRRGDLADADYAVYADIYCDYRSNLAPLDGYERYGIFARDDGVGGFGLTTSSSFGTGNCYAMMYDSDSGRVRAGKFVNGTLIDFLAANPLTLPSTAWRQFGIQCLGNQIIYSLNGAQIANVTDDTFASGCFGIGYHSLLWSHPNIRGTRADNLTVLSPLSPSAHFAGNQTSGMWPLQVRFHNLPAGGPTSSWLWNFGDNNTSTLQNPVHIFAFPGLYTVSLTVSGPSGGASKTRTDYIRVFAHPGDFDEDGDVDQEDFGFLQACLTMGTNPACARADLDGDTKVDHQDLQLFLSCVSGPGISSNSQCTGN